MEFPILEYEAGLSTETEQKLKKILERMPDIKEHVRHHHKHNSQTMMSLMTLNMISAGPYRVLWQILAQINKKDEALRQNLYRLAKKKIQIEELKNLDSQSPISTLGRLKLDNLEADLTMAEAPIINAIKEIGALQDRYEEVKANYNIPSNWNEIDFEKAEIKHHITNMFRLAIRDRMAGTHNNGTMEYMESFGIEPMLAYSLVDSFIGHTYKNIRTGNAVSITSRYEFYEDMHTAFKNEYKYALERLGINSAFYEEWCSQEGNI